MGFIRKHTEPSCRVIDVGAGASLLVDALLDAGCADPIALDVSARGLGYAKARLGERARWVKWIVADVTKNPKLPAVDEAASVSVPRAACTARIGTWTVP